MVISWGESRSRNRGGKNRVDNLEVMKSISSLIELEIGVLAFGNGFNRRDMGFGRWVWCGSLLGGFRRAGEHLNNLFKGGGIGLDESGGVWVSGIGSVDEFGGRRLKAIGGGG